MRYEAVGCIDPLSAGRFDKCQEFVRVVSVSSVFQSADIVVYFVSLIECLSWFNHID